MKKLRRLMCILISAAMFLGTLNVNVTAAAEETVNAAAAELINLAPSATITSTGGIAAAHTNWVDENPNTVGSLKTGYYGGSFATTEVPDFQGVYAEFDLGSKRGINSVEVTFPSQGDNDASGYTFYYSLFGKESATSELVEIVKDATATRTTAGRTKTHSVDLEYRVIRLVVTKITITAAAATTGGWYEANVAEVKIFGESGASGVQVGGNLTPAAIITSTGNDAAAHEKWYDGKYAGTNADDESVNGPLKSGKYDATLGQEIFAQFAFPSDQDISNVRVAFPNYPDDPAAYTYTYSLLGKKAGRDDWVPIAENQTARRYTGQNVKDHTVGEAYSVIRLDILKITNTKEYDNVAQIVEFVITKGSPTTPPTRSTNNIAKLASITSTANNSAAHANLIDGNYGSLGTFGTKFYGNGVTGNEYVQFDFDGNANMSSIEVAFEKSANPDPYLNKFYYDLLGRKPDGNWEPIVTGVRGTRTNPIKTYNLPAETVYDSIKLIMTGMESYNGGGPWPALAELKIFGENPVVTNNDPNNIAFGKPVHTRISGDVNNSIVNDKTSNNAWGPDYPAYADIDLEANYDLSSVEVFVPTAGYSRYSVFTSMDGRDFDLWGRKESTDSSPATGDIYNGDKEARYVRVYVEYQSTSSQAKLNEIKVRGTATDTEIETAPAINIENYEGSEYSVQVTADDAIEEVEGIITRNFGSQYINWFDFSIESNSVNTDYDYFEISDAEDGKILITGNSGVSLATGLNHYLKYFCKVHISQVGNQTDMPDSAPPVGETVRKETKFKLRYAYNYCTHSYTMAFWDEDEWRKELDWLALNGVTLVLDITAQEEVWRRFLGDLGYTHQEIKDFLVGPAYYAWEYMQNMTSFGGPIHDSWFEKRTKLARENQLIMRKLGMQPVFQAYSGMVPTDIMAHDNDLVANDVVGMGGWGNFIRPSMIRTTEQAYRDYAKSFYETQEEVFGDIAQYFATDPFHESGGNTGGMAVNVVSREVAKALVDYKEDGIWVIQSWESNPDGTYMSGLTDYKDNILVLDLNADIQPRWDNKATDHGGPEFSDSPWVWCMLNNFGGRMGLYGHISNIVSDVPKAANSTNRMKGIGITPEASMSNPLLFDLFFETIWSETPDNLQEIEINQWLRDYAERRYGSDSDAAYNALLGFLDTAYDSDLNDNLISPWTGGMDVSAGAPESVVNATPDTNITGASGPGDSQIFYDKADFEAAVWSLLEDYDTLKSSDAYLYDVAEVLKQLLANTAQEYQKEMATAFNDRQGELQDFTAEADRFLDLIDFIEEVLSTREEFMVGPWIEDAKALAPDDFSKTLYEFNARVLNTTWGVSHNSSLKDYANRQWAGMTADYYKARWEEWIKQAKNVLGGGSWNTINWFQIEWDWVISRQEYDTTASGEDLKELADYAFENYALSIPVDTTAENLEFRDADGKHIDALTADKMSVAYIHKNESGSEQSLIMTAAVYSPDGKLVHTAATEAKTAKDGLTTTFSVMLDLPDDIGALDEYTAKVYLWDSAKFVPAINSLGL